MTIESYLAATLNKPPTAPLLAGARLGVEESPKAFICGFLSEPLVWLLILMCGVALTLDSLCRDRCRERGRDLGQIISKRFCGGELVDHERST